MFAGPSFTFASRRYMQKEFECRRLGGRTRVILVYDAPAGADAVGLGFSSTRLISQHWVINFDSAVSRLLGGASQSPDYAIDLAEARQLAPPI